MPLNRVGLATSGCAVAIIAVVLSGVVPRTFAQAQAPGPAPTAAPAAAEDPVKVLVGRLDLERYKATIKSLTRFGDRLQGTDRNKAAIDWIAAQLTRYGCAPQ